MPTTEYAFLSVLLVALAAVLTLSKTARIVVVQSLMHPLEGGQIITWDDGTVEYIRGGTIKAEETDEQRSADISPGATETETIHFVITKPAGQEGAKGEAGPIGV
jgi:hypothetical protein